MAAGHCVGEALPTPPGEPWGVIPQLLGDLTRAFDGLRQENERLRAQVQLPREASVVGLDSDGLTAQPSARVQVSYDESTYARSEMAAAARSEGRSLHRLPAAPMGPSAVAAHVRMLGGDAEGLRSNDDARPVQPLPLAVGAQWNEGDCGETRSENSNEEHFTIPADLQIEPYATAPEHGTLLKVWSDDEVAAASTQVNEPSHYGHGESWNQRSQNVAKVGDVLEGSGPFRFLMLSPNACTSVVWDFLSIITLSVDMLLSPLIVFGLEVPKVFVIYSAGFWTLDIFMQCRTGVYVNGRLNMIPHEVLCRYLKSTFAFDMIMMIMDWITVIGRGSVLGKILRVEKGVRFVRLLRLVRLLRVIKFLVKFEPPTFGRSYTWIAILKVMKKVVFIVVINHFVACSWYGLSSTADSYGVKSWAMALPSDTEAIEPSVQFKYFTALHWALAQFTPATIEVYPRNPAERVFTMVLMIISLLAFSSVVASMTSTMTQLMNRNADQIIQKELLARFINEHKVSVNLSTRIASFLKRERVRKERRPVLESQVPLLKKLPDGLKKELHREVFTNALLRHPLFLELDARDGSNLEVVCHTAMEDEFFATREAIWTLGDVAKKMFFVLRGGLRSFAYTIAADTHPLPPHLAVDAKVGDILSEQALWLNWHYSSEMVSVTDVACFTLDSAKFAEIARLSAGASLLVVYAKLFQERAPVASDLPPDWNTVKGMVMDAVRLDGPELTRNTNSLLGKLRGSISRRSR